jgi:hypothetical protein
LANDVSSTTGYTGIENVATIYRESDSVGGSLHINTINTNGTPYVIFDNIVRIMTPVGTNTSNGSLSVEGSLLVTHDAFFNNKVSIYGTNPVRLIGRSAISWLPATDGGFSLMSYTADGGNLYMQSSYTDGHFVVSMTSPAITTTNAAMILSGGLGVLRNAIIGVSVRVGANYTSTGSTSGIFINNSTTPLNVYKIENFTGSWTSGGVSATQSFKIMRLGQLVNITPTGNSGALTTNISSAVFSVVLPADYRPSVQMSYYNINEISGGTVTGPFSCNLTINTSGQLSISNFVYEEDASTSATLTLWANPVDWIYTS